MTTFKVDGRPDGGEFADGNGAALKWDVLRQAGRRDLSDIIDLSGCRHLKPYAVACLCGLGELAKHERRSIKAIAPVNHECKSHLARLGVPEFFDCDWQVEPDRSSNFKARRVHWPPHDAAEMIVELLAPRVDLPPAVFPRMAESLDEVIVT